MDAIRVAAAALLGMAALSLIAPAAPATGSGTGTGTGTGDSTPFGFSVQPSTVAAGGRVTLRVEGCTSQTRVSSRAFSTITLPEGRSSATTEVDWDARRGAVYAVTFRCGGKIGHADLTVAGHPIGHRARIPVDRGVEVPAGWSAGVPVDRGVKAGIGGSADGINFKEIGLGAGLVAGSLGAAYHWSRRRTTDERS